MGHLTPGRQRRAAVGLLAVLVATACGKKPAVGNGPYARDIADAIPIVERGTGLKFKGQPTVRTRTRQQFHEFLEQTFLDSTAQEQVAGQQILLRRLGLIPDTLDLRDMMIRLLAEQVVAFYDPHTKTLNVVDSAPPDQAGLEIQHELVHALQDQYMNLDSIQHLREQNDRAMAAQAVIEGQATLVPLLAANGPMINLPGGFDRVRDEIREGHTSSMQVLRSAPMILQETLIFPYLSGTQFMHEFVQRMPGKQPFGPNMPTSTEQILHPTEFFGKRLDPLAITLPSPAQGKVTYVDDMGEFQTRLFLFQFLQDQNVAVRGASGWAGDRYEVIHFPSGDGIAWLTAWRSAIQAGEFGSDAEQIVAKRFDQATVRHGKEQTSYEVNGRTITVWGGSLAGHPVVLYTDLPAGVEPGTIRIQKTRIE